jgi:hypothetical protein
VSPQGCRRYQRFTHLSLGNALEAAAVFDEDAAGGAAVRDHAVNTGEFITVLGTGLGTPPDGILVITS